MSYQAIKRGKPVTIATVKVREKRREKLFPGHTRSAKQKATAWERAKRKEIVRSTGSETSVQIWVDKYLRFAKVKFKGRNTYKAKKTALKKFSKFIGHGAIIENVKTEECLQYLQKQTRQRTGNAANRDRKELATAWAHGVEFFDFPEINPFRKVKKFPEDKKDRYVPPFADFLKILALVKGQDWVMLMVFLCLAPRRGEVFGIKRLDVDFNNKRIRLWTRKRKGSNLESDWLPAVPELLDILKTWLPIRKSITAKNSSHIFISPRTKKPFQTRVNFLKKLCKKARVRRFTFHAIRHLAAIYLYHNGEKTQIIQLILRHKDPRTTDKYLKRIGAEEGRKGLAKISSEIKPIITAGLDEFKSC